MGKGRVDERTMAPDLSNELFFSNWREALGFLFLFLRSTLIPKGLASEVPPLLPPVNIDLVILVLSFGWNGFELDLALAFTLFCFVFKADFVGALPFLGSFVRSSSLWRSDKDEDYSLKATPASSWQGEFSKTLSLYLLVRT